MDGRKKRRVYRVIFLLIVVLFSGSLIRLLLPVRFYYDFPYRTVSSENKDFFRKFYREHKGDLERIFVAQDGRSAMTLRAVFCTDDRISREEQQEYLEELLTFMQVMQAEETWYPMTWEVYFWQNQLAYGGYVSMREGEWYRHAAEYADWQEIPGEVLQQIDWDALQEILSNTMFPLYDNNLKAIEDCEPNLPPYF